LCPQSFLDTIEGAKELQDAELDDGAMTKEKKVELQKLLLENRNEECSICSEAMTQPRITPCGHMYDSHCLEEWLSSKSESSVAHVDRHAS
jgi:SWI/SNF-related matrix-associated actin-dependent regulator of chromatin subfamily A3